MYLGVNNWMLKSDYILLDERKHPLHKFKDGAGVKTWDEVKDFDNVGMIIPYPYIILDFDTVSDAEIMLRVVEALELKCRVLKTERGYHFWFKYSGSEKLKNFTKGRLVIGIYCDRKVCNRNAYVKIKGNGKLRTWLKDYEDSEVEELPKWLYQVSCNSTLFNFKGMASGDGRNQQLFNYIVYLQDKGFKRADILEILEIINCYVFDEPLSKSELKSICREEAFKPELEENDSNNINYPMLRGNKPIPHKDNIKALLTWLNYDIRYNAITKEIELYSMEKRVNTPYSVFVSDFKGEALASGLFIGKDTLYDILSSIAYENKFNPLADYFKECYKGWDGEKVYIDAFCNCLELEEEQDVEFIHTLITKWFIQGVKLANNDGEIKPATILVLKGVQGLGKSRLIKALLPKNPELVLSEAKIDFNSKDDIIKTTCYGITELAEISRSLKDMDRLKAMLTSEKDIYRPPFARVAESHPRHTNFAGSTNDDTFLVDGSGGERRFSVIPLSKIRWDLFEALNMDAVWGEVYNMAIIENVPYWLTGEELKKQNKYNLAHRNLTELEQRLADMYDFEAPEAKWNLYTATQVARVILHNDNMSAVVGRALKRLHIMGIIPKPIHKNGYGNSYLYKLPPERVL